MRELEPDLTLQIVDLADGRERVMGSPAGARCTAMHYASATEVMLLCSVSGTAYLSRVDPRRIPYQD